MRKIITISSLLLFGFINAQTVKYGVTGNFHKSSIPGIHDRSKGIFGGGLGIFADFSLVTNDIYNSAWLYFSPQLEFNTQGENAQMPGLETQKYHNNYIGIPLYIKYFMKSQGYKGDIYFMAGPRFEFMVANKVSGPVSLTAHQEENLEKFGYGISAGVGVNIQNSWDVFIRYDRGFSKIYPDYTKYTTYNRMLAIGINLYLSESGF
ncbi:porin family protein [Epilithonimonas sp.]|uniref:porin family protein n=1 Tax=Epilithonimonas sp. TaxID=2894511 RepID=UPI00289C5A39|nr:porin family protein [Epilithonimonas sp.]